MSTTSPTPSAVPARFQRAAASRGLFAPGDSVLAAVSGGSDSVALLRLLVEHAPARLRLVVAHVNHGLRGAASDADQRFVETLAARLGLRCVSLAMAPSARAAGGEQGLRRARRALLREAAGETGCARIALGHTMDDQAETLLMRTIRGTGRRGLAGIAWAGPGLLVRPLLGLRRHELRAWLEALGQDWREDESNLDERLLRNRVRRRVVPLLEEINPGIARVLARSARVMADEDRFLDGLAEGVLEGNVRVGQDGGLAIQAAVLAAMHPALARRAARILIARSGGDPRGASTSSVECLLDLARRPVPCGEMGLRGGLRAARDGADLILWGPGNAAPDDTEAFSLEMPIPGQVAVDAADAVIEARVVGREEGRPPAGGVDRALLDADRLGSIVTVRSRLPGDRFHPLGGPGRRRLKEFLIDGKIPKRRRDRIPLVVGPEGIAWVVGVRIGDPYRLTEATRRVAVLEYRRRGVI